MPIKRYNGTSWDVVAGDGAVGTSGTASLTTKGDIQTFDTAANRLPVGSDGQTLVANSANASGLGWNQNFAAGKNKIINGDFGIWQRGTSFSNFADSIFFADRFINFRDGTGATTVASQQTFTPGTAPVAGYEGTFFQRYAVTVAGSGNTYRYIDQRMEDVRTLAGQTATFSFWAKADAARSLVVTAVQFFGSGGSGDVGTSVGTFSLTTSWQRFTATISIPSIAGKTIGTNSFLYIRLSYPANATFTIDTWGLQLEAGSVATAFQTATGTLQGELAACQRYYYQWVTGRSGSGGTGLSMGLGNNYSATQLNLTCSFPVTLRTLPTLVASTGTNYYKFERNSATDSFNSLTIYQAGTNQAMLYNSSEISGTAGQAGSVSTDADLSSVAFSAEL